MTLKMSRNSSPWSQVKHDKKYEEHVHAASKLRLQFTNCVQLCKDTFIAREKFPPTKIHVSRHLCLPGLCDINVFPVSETEVLRHRLVRERRVGPTPFL